MESTITSKLFIGIDVHKRQWSISIYTSTIHHRTFSQPPDPRALKSYIDKHFNDYQVDYLIPFKINCSMFVHRGSRYNELNAGISTI